MAKLPYPSHLNPTLTSDLAQDVAFFRKWGYLVVDNAITQTQVRSLRAALNKTFKRRGEQFIHQLLEEFWGILRLQVKRQKKILIKPLPH